MICGIFPTLPSIPMFVTLMSLLFLLFVGLVVFIFNLASYVSCSLVFNWWLDRNCARIIYISTESAFCWWICVWTCKHFQSWGSFQSSLIFYWVFLGLPRMCEQPPSYPAMCRELGPTQVGPVLAHSLSIIQGCVGSISRPFMGL